MNHADLQRMNLIWIAMIMMVILGISTGTSYDDAVDQQEIYCQNVVDGIHPDYEQAFDKWCK